MMNEDIRLIVKMLLFLLFYSVNCQECERLVSLPAKQPVIRFDFDFSIPDSYVRLEKPNGSPIFQAFCGSKTCYSAEYLNSTLASTGDIATGKFHIKLDSFGDGQQGNYTFRTSGGETVLKCIKLYLLVLARKTRDSSSFISAVTVLATITSSAELLEAVTFFTFLEGPVWRPTLGKPRPPSIRANREPYEGGTVILTCHSISTTDPPGHGLVMSYTWTKDGTKVTSGGRFNLLPNTAATLTLTKVQRTDELSQFTCTATEEKSLTSDNSTAFYLTVYCKEIECIYSFQVFPGSVSGTLQAFLHLQMDKGSNFCKQLGCPRPRKRWKR
ncbi:hypothetical protein MAR_021085 [Mya arenaria]|uniref:Ig-like domain-containing protein n=1 Tax=Mya arenaria TaxID=6604 RepID=A0ABY7EAP4_MYAAR|nr:hypothetical protein MAR_021085 [Mya arenaria]